MMFKYMLLILFIVMFIKLGVYLVWLTVLSAFLKIILFIIAGFMIPIIWRKLFKKNNRSIDLH